MRQYPKSTESDQATLEIKYIIDEIIDRSGKVDNVRLELPKSCMTDVLKTLDRVIVNNFKFKLAYDDDKIILVLGEDLE